MTDARDLSARMQALSEALNPLIGRVEQTLSGIGVGIAVFVPLGPGLQLCFDPGYGRLYLIRGDERKLLTSASRETRLRALRLLPNVVDELRAQTAERIEADSRIIADAEAFVADLERRAFR